MVVDNANLRIKVKSFLLGSSDVVSPENKSLLIPHHSPNKTLIPPFPCNNLPVRAQTRAISPMTHLSVIRGCIAQLLVIEAQATVIGIITNWRIRTLRNPFASVLHYLAGAQLEYGIANQ